MMQNGTIASSTSNQIGRQRWCGVLFGVLLLAGTANHCWAAPPDHQGYPVKPGQIGRLGFPHPQYAPHSRYPQGYMLRPEHLAHSGKMQQWKEAVARQQQDALPLATYIRVLGPENTRVVFFDADASEHVRPSPVTAGVRARHRYAFAIENTPYGPGQRYYGTIEVLRGPRLPEGVNGAETPIPVRFTDQDCATLAKAQMLTKIVVLEDPDQALAAPVGPDETIVYEGTMYSNVVELAKTLGKMVLVVRIGDRIPSKDELVGVAVAGSLLLPKVNDPESYAFVDGVNKDILQTAFHGRSHAISRPPSALSPEACDTLGPVEANCANGACPPGGNFPGWPFVDRFHGEYLCDGGDLGLKADRNQFNVLVNVDPSDTIAEYHSNYDQYRVVESNRVCVYSPRYVEVRHSQMVEGFQVERLAEFVARDRSMDSYNQIVAGIEAVHQTQPQAVRMRQRASGFVREQWSSGYYEVRILEGVDNKVGIGVGGTMKGPELLNASQQLFLAKQQLFTVELTRDQFPKVFARLEGLGQLIMVWRHQEVVSIEEKLGLGRLMLEKSASQNEAKIGETVSFEIKYTNIGDEPVQHVAIVDSLLARLEYVVDSAESSRDAVFTAEANDVGSSTLRWEIKGALPPGESGTVTFEAKVR